MTEQQTDGPPARAGRVNSQVPENQAASLRAENLSGANRAAAPRVAGRSQAVMRATRLFVANPLATGLFAANLRAAAGRAWTGLLAHARSMMRARARRLRANAARVPATPIRGRSATAARTEAIAPGRPRANGKTVLPAHPQVNGRPGAILRPAPPDHLRQWKPLQEHNPLQEHMAQAASPR